MNLKSEVWEYEQERRMIFYSEDEVEDFYSIENVEIEAVYFGIKVSKENENRIRKELANTNIAIFKMKYGNKDLMNIKHE